MKREMIPLTQLLLSDDNPRLNIYDNTDILKEMVIDQQDKIYELAEDILEYGLSPLDIWAVYPTGNNFYKVAEGNRRLTSLVLLNNPELIKDIDPRIYSRIKSLLSKSKNSSPNNIECVIYDSIENKDLQHWLQLRHLGLNRGRGVDAWDSVQKARYEQKIYGVSALLDFWNEIIDRKILTQHQVASISKTNWERILNKKGRDYLGLVKNQKNYIIPNSNIDIFTIKIRKIAEKLSNQTVGLIYDNDRIQDFLNEVDEEIFGKKTPDVYESESELELEETSIESVSHTPVKLVVIEESVEIKSSNGDSSGSTKKDIFTNCKTIIPYSYPLKSSNIRINKIIIELKKLDVDEYPNACGALLRLLFELSAKHYIERLFGNDSTESDFLSVITAASNELIKNKKLNKNEHSSLSVEKDTLRLLFNGYMHATSGYPSSTALKGFFKSHHNFISLCLE